MESPRHNKLKLFAAAFLRGQGCAAVALEVRCPASRFRADVAAHLDKLPRHGRIDTTAAPNPSILRTSHPKTIVVECKQSRADFLRDTANLARLLAARDRLESQRLELEETRIKPHEPQLRQSGSFLFPDLESWDFSATRLPTYRRILEALRDIEVQLYGQTKFWRMSHYRLANHLYMLAPAGMIRRRELPRGWGLLECPGRLLRLRGGPGFPPELDLHLAVEAPEHPTRPEHQARLLRNIAAAATRAWMAPLAEPDPASTAAKPAAALSPAEAATGFLF